MECPKCGAENAPLKKCCYRCGAILSGHTINNVTGEYGYRNPDGTFTKEPKNSDVLQQSMQNVANALEGIFGNGATISFPVPIGKLIHEPTKAEISVYKPISRFKALMLRWCFGLKYHKYDKER